MRKFLLKLWDDESGVASVEYVLLLAMIGSAIILGASALGDAVGNELTDTSVCIATGVCN